jgi:hypothetical protein
MARTNLEIFPPEEKVELEITVRSRSAVHLARLRPWKTDSVPEILTTVLNYALNYGSGE